MNSTTRATATTAAAAAATAASLGIAAAATGQGIEIFEAIPNEGGRGDLITLVGRGFGTDPDALCVAVENGPDLLFMKTLAANERTLLVELGNIPPDATPGPFVVELGEGVVDTFRPNRPNILSPSDNWVWRRTTGLMGRGDFDFIARPDGPPPPRTRWFYGDVEDGKAVVEIDGTWPPNAEIVLAVRLIGSGAARSGFTGAEYFNNLMEPDSIQTFYHVGATALECAFDVCDHIACALEQIQDIITDCQVEDLGGGRARISVCFTEGTIVAGTFNLCVVEQPVVRAFSTDHYPYWWIDDAVLEFEGESLVINNIGDSGDEGVTLDLQESAIGVSIETEPLAIEPRQAVSLSAWGTLNGVPAQPLASFGIRNDVGVAEVFADYAALGTSQVQVEMYNGGVFVGRTVVPIGVVGTYPPGQGALHVTGLLFELSEHPRAPGPPEEHPILRADHRDGSITQDQPLFFVARDNTTFFGDELHLVAVGDGARIDGVKVVDLQGRNLPRVVITDEVLIGRVCVADLDGSGAVDFGDILAVLSAWGQRGGPEDLDGSGFVDFGDLLVILSAWGACP